MLVEKYYSGGVVFLLFSIFTVICFISWIKRIPFSVVMLQTSIDVSKKYGHVYMVSLLGGILACALGAWYSITLVAIYAKYEPDGGVGSNPACTAGGGGCSSGKVIGLIVCITFAMYWISEVLKNVIHVAISGVYGSWYFCPNNLPRGPTRGALRRALTCMSSKLHSIASHYAIGRLTMTCRQFRKHMLRQSYCRHHQQLEATLFHRQEPGDAIRRHDRCYLRLLLRLPHRHPRVGSHVFQPLCLFPHRALWKSLYPCRERYLAVRVLRLVRKAITDC